MQRNSSLEEYIRTGVRMDCEVTPQVLLTIFWPKTELHDGAAIIDGSGRIASSASVLPLSSARTLATPKLGTRHRAALGMSEVSDAICVVVSEETGRISITAASFLLLMPSLQAAPNDRSAPQVVVKPVTSTAVTASGQPITLPQKDAHVVVTTYDIGRGANLPEHKHSYARYAYVLVGTLRVTNTETGRRGRL